MPQSQMMGVAAPGSMNMAQAMDTGLVSYQPGGAAQPNPNQLDGGVEAIII